MSPETGDPISIGPNTPLANVQFPRDLGEQFMTLYGTDEPPENGAAWVEGMHSAMEAVRDRKPTVDDLCTVDDGDHAFVGPDTTQSYICVLDPLAYPFLTGSTGIVRSQTPIRDATVEFEIREDGITVSHDEAVVSIGISDHLGHAGESTVETIYRQVCGYIQTFQDHEEYETWAADVDAATTSVSADEGVAVAREIATHLFESDRA